MQDHLHGDGPGAVSSGRPDSVCNPAVSATAFGCRPGRVAGAQYGKQGCHRPPTGWTGH